MTVITSSGVTRRGALSVLAAGAATASGLFQGPAFAANWPDRPVRIIVPFAPGGGADGSARVLGELLGADLGQPIIVENRPGAGGSIGVMAAVQSKDRHTLLMGSNSMVIGPLLNQGYGYEVARDLDAIGMVSSQPLVLVVPASSSIKTVAQLVAQAKAKPGDLSAGNSGNGTLAHLTAELFAQQAGLSIISVPYRGESALMPDLISGLVSTGFLNLPSVLPHIRAGKLRALAVSSPQPVAELPGVTTLAAQGYPELEVRGWAALMAPKGLTDAELARLEQSLAKALATSSVQSRFANFGVTPYVRGRTQTRDLLNQESERWRQLIKARNIQANT